jgi:hypothetical protein
MYSMNRYPRETDLPPSVLSVTSRVLQEDSRMMVSIRVLAGMQRDEGVSAKIDPDGVDFGGEVEDSQ